MHISLFSTVYKGSVFYKVCISVLYVAVRFLHLVCEISYINPLFVMATHLLPKSSKYIRKCIFDH